MIIRNKMLNIFILIFFLITTGFIIFLNFTLQGKYLLSILQKNNDYYFINLNRLAKNSKEAEIDLCILLLNNNLLISAKNQIDNLEKIQMNKREKSIFFTLKSALYLKYQDLNSAKKYAIEALKLNPDETYMQKNLSYILMLIEKESTKNETNSFFEEISNFQYLDLQNLQKSQNQYIGNQLEKSSGKNNERYW
ncbi:MAG TPA: hypothetical protein PK520_08320, partial [Exilispira sp.]|nr:hypothetical protein [Exilispira sp.]